MKLKPTRLLVLMLVTICGLNSCSLFGGEKKRQPPKRTGSSFLGSDSPVLGSEGPNLGTSKERQ